MAVNSTPGSRVADSTYRAFMAGFNADMRAAGFPGSQVKVGKNGKTDTAPGIPKAVRALPAGNGVALLWKHANDDTGHPPAYRIYRDGSLLTTVRGSTWYTDHAGGSDHDYEIRAVDKSGTEGDSAVVALAGARSLTKSGRHAVKSGDAGATAAAQGGAQLAPPSITNLEQSGADTFRVTMDAVPGAESYGVYIDGALAGSVSDPSFIGSITTGDPSVIAFDAVSADGVRSARSGAIQLGLGSDGKLSAAQVDG